MSAALRRAEAEKRAIEEKLAAADKRVAVAQANRSAQCEHCKKRTRIRRLIFIQTYWYTPPHGCTGGDYWNAGEGQWICPRCRHLNRMCGFNGQEWLAELMEHFASVFDKHDYSIGSSLYSRCVVDREDARNFEEKWREMYGYRIDLGAQ